MKVICLIVFMLFGFSAFSFEIKPEGNNSGDWNTLVEYKQENSDECDGKCYKVFDAMPVHEIITAKAAKSLCDKYENEIKGIFSEECAFLRQKGNYSSNDPLISGSEFNDDPTGVLRRDSPNWLAPRDWLNAGFFEKIMKKEGSLTYESHYGKLQFLHAMRSEYKLENEKSEDTLKKILDYISENFNMARNINQMFDNNDVENLLLLLDKQIEETYYKFLIGNEGECFHEGFSENVSLEPRKLMNYGKIFDRCGIFRFGYYPEDKFLSFTNDKQARERSRAIALMALGSALHVIQDSYSSSHVLRDKENKVIEFYHYPNNDDGLEPKLHCAHDQYTSSNDHKIQDAINKSYAFLLQFNEMKCNSSDDDKNTCKKMISKWLAQEVFAK